MALLGLAGASSDHAFSALFWPALAYSAQDLARIGADGLGNAQEFYDVDAGLAALVFGQQ